MPTGAGPAERLLSTPGSNTRHAQRIAMRTYSTQTQVSINTKPLRRHCSDRVCADGVGILVGCRAAISRCTRLNDRSGIGVVATAVVFAAVTGAVETAMS